MNKNILSNELMPGDIVSLEGFLVQVTYVDDKGLVGYIGLAEEREGLDTDFEAVPISADFLRSHGFTLTSVGDNGPLTPKGQLNRYEEWKRVLRLVPTVTVLFDRMTGLWCLPVLSAAQLVFVHELQHAMRLARLGTIIL